jgi:hypothetical protein
LRGKIKKKNSCKVHPFSIKDIVNETLKELKKISHSEHFFFLYVIARPIGKC